MSGHVNEFWRHAVIFGAWSLAVVWCVRVRSLLKGLPTVVDLGSLDWSNAHASATLVVVIPARDEADKIAATLEALVAADYSQLMLIAVDDRSADATGAIMDEIATRSPDRLKVIHITQSEPGWLGKTFALELALRNTESEYVLFTDADVLFSPSILRRAMAYVESSRADHLVVMPTMQIQSWGEGTVLGFFQILGMWATRPWRVPDPKSKRDSIGMGAFNLLRRGALEAMGGLEPQKLVVLEDITLGRRIKAAGLRQRVAFAPGLLLIHWAKGARGLVNGMSKNLFSGVNFRPALLLAGCLWIVMFCLVPIVGLAWWGTLAPAMLVLLCMASAYRMLELSSGIDARYGLLYPLGAVLFVYAMLRSMVVVWRDRGVVWRGTHYPLAVLRLHNSPFRWEREARKKRAG